MACSAKQRNRVIIRRYDQLSEFGYCLHNVLKYDILSPRAFLNPSLSCPRFLRMAPSFRDPPYTATDPNPQGYSVFQAPSPAAIPARLGRCATSPEHPGARRSAAQRGRDMHRRIGEGRAAGVPWAEGLGKGDFRKAGKSRLSD
jgi:hypothetical protein